MAQPAPPLAFDYHGKLAPMMWVFVALAAAELFVVHLLVSLLWSLEAAVVLSAVTLLSMLWLIGLIRSFRKLPILVDEEGILMRSGKLNEIRVDGNIVLRVRRDFPSQALKQRGVSNLALLSYPNVLVELAEPVRRSRRQPVTAVAHALDDPEAFAAAVATVQRR